MRNALQSLPGVEKDSVKVNKDQKLATFKVKDAAAFKVDDAVAKVTGLGGKYTATVAKKGKSVGAPNPDDAKPAAGDKPNTGGEKK